MNPFHGTAAYLGVGCLELPGEARTRRMDIKRRTRILCYHAQRFLLFVDQLWSHLFWIFWSSNTKGPGRNLQIMLGPQEKLLLFMRRLFTPLKFPSFFISVGDLLSCGASSSYGTSAVDQLCHCLLHLHVQSFCRESTGAKSNSTFPRKTWLPI